MRSKKVEADHSVLLFQIGEFGQLVSNDQVKATKHIVKKTLQGVERFAFALFYNLQLDYVATSHSVLTQDSRFTEYRFAETRLPMVSGARRLTPNTALCKFFT